MKRDDIKSDHVKTINSLDIKISAITPKRRSSYYEQPYDYITNCPLLKPPEKYLHASKFTKHMSLTNLEVDTLPQLQNVGMPFVPPSANTYQQKRSGHHKNISNQ